MAGSLLDTLVDTFANPLVNGFSCLMKLLGPILILAFYALIGLHLYAFFGVELFILKTRVGTRLGLLWTGIGLCLLYNLFFNHFMAYLIKPGSPKDLVRIENKRLKEKARGGKRDLDNGNLTDLERLTVNDDKFDGASKSVKKLLSYRSKTMT